jgi:hypothetical protein
MVAHAYSLSYSGGRGKSIMTLGSAWKISETLYQKQNTNKGWGHGSSSRALAHHMRGHGFNLQYH